jgi:hypothetical protein
LHVSSSSYDMHPSLAKGQQACLACILLFI